jgi:hypothetical protein
MLFDVSVGKDVISISFSPLRDVPNDRAPKR